METASQDPEAREMIPPDPSHPDGRLSSLLSQVSREALLRYVLDGPPLRTGDLHRLVHWEWKARQHRAASWWAAAHQQLSMGVVSLEHLRCYEATLEECRVLRAAADEFLCTWTDRIDQGSVR